MDPLQSPSVGFGWDHHAPNQMPTPIPHDLMAYTTPHELAGMQYAHPTAQVSQSHRSPILGLSNHRSASRLSDVDSHMIDSDAVPTIERRPKPVAARRTKQAQLDWNGNRDKLYQLYIEEGQVLSETMKIMKQNHGFDAK